MKKNALFIHSAGPQEGLQGSSGLAASLQEAIGAEYNLFHPQMPHPETPTYKRWKRQLEKECVALNGEVILIGHSLGGSVLLKFLSEGGARHLTISGLFMIAAPYWGKGPDWQNDEYTLRENFVLRLPSISHLFLYHSRGDTIVPLAHQRYYQKQLPQATSRILHGEDHLFPNGIPELVADMKRLKSLKME
ncbi:alpha/beta hydrolase [Desmospora profundinema]|uniref:Alpha/beta hydrolase family esterase n=1 Tax=Desmospora profundinema TaxID=1571184 RepID=A0ABU1IJW9_9BACL|nr:alpha/beta hydrolase [Desmospora profundinema]MDR6225072.1 putative alpha/beta hydrolase family esterase [Desmospora profundinema]